MTQSTQRRVETPMSDANPPEGPEDTMDEGPVTPDAETEGAQSSAEEGLDASSSEGETAAEEAQDAPVQEPAEDLRDLRIRALESILQEKEKTLHEYIRAYKKEQTDLEAFKDRLQREQAEELFAAKAKATEALIEVLDNLQLSVDAASRGGTVESMTQGVQMVADQFRSVLKQQGLEEISPTGQAFDPACMEAMSVIPVTDADQDNMVLATLKPGYRIGEREVRPALVQVGRKPA